jgi:hypothetical protein
MPNESDVDQLYKDAYFFHLVNRGLSDFLAEYEANKAMLQKKKQL